MSAAVEQSPLPTRAAIRGVVEGLVGREIELTDAEPVTLSGSEVVAVYVTDQLRAAAVAVVDLAGGIRLGGALGMLPKGGVDDAVKDKDLSGMIRANCYEVLNVLASVFNLADAPHVRLYQMFGPEDSVPGDVRELAHLSGSREDVAIALPGYGRAVLSIVVK